MIRSILLLLLCIFGLVTEGQAQTVGSQLKAALLYRFAQFSEWPPHAPAVPLYCVAGDESVEKALALMLQQAQVQQVTKASQTKQCTVVYLSADLVTQSEWLPVLQQSGCLTVVEGAEWFRKGAIFGLIVEPKRISFRVNLTIAREQGFHLSAQMLKLAKEIH